MVCPHILKIHSDFFQSTLGSRAINYNYPLCLEEDVKASEQIIALTKVILSLSKAAEMCEPGIQEEST